MTGGDSRTAADHGDAAVALFDEMPGGAAHSQFIVGTDAVDADSVDGAAHENDRHDAVYPQNFLGGRSLGRTQDHTVGTVLHQRFDKIGLASDILAVPTQQGGVFAQAQFVFDAREHFGEIRIDDVVEGDADNVGPAGPQARRGRL